MKLLTRLDASLNKVEGILLVSLLAIMVLMAFLQVVLRNFFSTGILWGDIFLRHLVLWIGFLGAALATSKERHISIDALTRFLPTRVKSAIRVLTNLFAAIVCYVLLRASLTFIELEREGETILYGNIPTWYAQVIIPAGFALLMAHFFIRSVLDARTALDGARG
jgi:TRAP-type C4-dicarboxylate transport system permease small subunit